MIEYSYDPPYNLWSGNRSDTLNKWKINYKGSIATASALPEKGDFKGDTYNVLEDGSNYMWNGNSWDKLDANVYVGATSTKDGIQGLVPPADSSERNKFLRGDGTYKDVSWSMIINKPQPPVPVGAVFYFAMSQAPVNYLVCDGSAISRETYSDLFTAIGTTYGTGDGTTTFNLPNLIGKFAEGANSNIGDNVDAGLPEIQGYQNFARYSVLGSYGGALGHVYKTDSSGVTHLSTSGQIGEYYTVEFNASKSNSIYGNSTTVQPPAVKLLPCIRALP